MAMPRMWPGVGATKRSRRVRIAGSLAKRMSRLIGARGFLAAGDLRACVRRSAHRCASVRRSSGDTRTWARAARSRWGLRQATLGKFAVEGRGRQSRDAFEPLPAHSSVQPVRELRLAEHNRDDPV